MLKKILSHLAWKMGIVNMSLRVAEVVLRNVEFEAEIPFSGWANDILEEAKKMAEDGKITNDEAADVVKFIRENR